MLYRGVVVAPEVSDGEVDPVELPGLALAPPLAAASVGVFTWPAAPPELLEVVSPAVDGRVDEAEGVELCAPVELLAPIEPVADPLTAAAVLVELAALVVVPVAAVKFEPDHQSREARCFGEAARYWSSTA